MRFLIFLFALTGLMIWHAPGVAAQADADSLQANPDSTAQARSDSARRVQVDSLVLAALARADSLSQAGDSTELAAELAATKLFNFSLGASFDVFKGLEPNDLYGDISAYVPRIWDKVPIALDFRIAQGRSFASRKGLAASRSFFTQYVDPKSGMVRRDGAVAMGTTDIEETREIVSVSAAYHIKLDRGRGNRLALINYFEHRVIDETLKFVNLTLNDTTGVDIPMDAEIIRRSPSRFFIVGDEKERLSESVSRDKNTLIGIGLGLDIPIKSFQFKIRPHLLLDRDRRNPDSKKIRAGHVVIFELIEWRHKVKLGGEVRRDPGARESEVEFSLYLSKVVSLRKFFEGLRDAL